MEKFRDTRVRYNHPAIPPVGISINTTYVVGYLVDSCGFNYKFIKTVFEPIDCNWNDLDKKQSKKNKKEVKEIETEEVNDGVEI